MQIHAILHFSRSPTHTCLVDLALLYIFSYRCSYSLSWPVAANLDKKMDAFRHPGWIRHSRSIYREYDRLFLCRPKAAIKPVARISPDVPGYLRLRILSLA